MHKPLSVELDSLLRSWMPSADGVAELYGRYSAAVNCAAARAGQARARALGEVALADRLSDLASAVESSRWTSPDVTFALYVGLRDGASAADVGRLVEALERACESQPSLRLHLGDPGRAWSRHLQQSCIDEAPRYGRLALEPPRLCGAPADHDCYGAAMDVLSAAWPEQARAAEVLIRDVVWWDGTGSATMAQMHGAVFMATGFGVARAIEVIVHEAAHLELYARTTFDKLLINWEQPGRSPLRDEPRPLLRVLHAGFFSQRIEYALARCLELVPSEERAEAEQRRQRFLRHRDDGVRTLATVGEWTPLGTSLIASMQAAAGLEPTSSD